MDNHNMQQQQKNQQANVCVKISEAKWPIKEIVFMLQGLLIISAWICLVITFTKNNDGLRSVFYCMLPFVLGLMTTLAGALAVCLRSRDSLVSMHRKRRVHISIVVWVLAVFVINTFCQLAAVQNLKILFDAPEIMTIIFTTFYLITVVCLLVLAVVQNCFISGTSEQDQDVQNWDTKRILI